MDLDIAKTSFSRFYHCRARQLNAHHQKLLKRLDLFK
jgi:hypothetical protein